MSFLENHWIWGYQHCVGVISKSCQRQKKCLSNWNMRVIQVCNVSYKYVTCQYPKNMKYTYQEFDCFVFQLFLSKTEW